MEDGLNEMSHEEALTESNIVQTERTQCFPMFVCVCGGAPSPGGYFSRF